MRKLNHQQFIEKAIVIHGEKYSYLNEYSGSNNKILIYCNLHGSFEQRAADHLRGSGCPQCAGNQKKNHIDFINEANIVHYNKYEYISIYQGDSYLLKIKCSSHGIFNQVASNHLQGQGCPQCAFDKNGFKKRITNEEFLSKARDIHGNKYQYLELYSTSDTKMSILCFDHGIFVSTPHNHIGNGSGCPRCADEERSVAYRKDFEVFVEQANNVHNGKYEYFSPYINGHTKIPMKCPIHGIFKQLPIHHLNGHECSRCTAGSNISKPETAWLDFLNIPLELRQASIKIDGKLIKPDAFDPATNTIYEFYGDYWHGNPAVFDLNKIHHLRKVPLGDLYQATLAREQLIKQAGYNLIFIWEYDWKRKLKNEQATNLQKDSGASR